MATATPSREPPSELGRLRILSSTAGIRVSPLALGGGNIGQSWSSTFGKQTKEGAFSLLDAFVKAGGNFLDTSNEYQNEESEAWIGEWMAARNNREDLVIATKFTSDYRFHATGRGGSVNNSGNHRRSLNISLRDSLRKLQTEFVDILYVHFWDFTTSIEEVMDALHIMVQQGKVLYLGISDTPAWIVSAANTYARLTAKTPFSVYQGRWNVLQRDFERDILPMTRHFGMAVVPWGVLGGGKFQTAEEIASREAKGDPLRGLGGAQTDVQARMSEALAKVAAEHGMQSVTGIALAYVRRKAADYGIWNVFPVIGGRKPEQLHENIAALRVKLTDEQVAYLEGVQSFDIGFPTDFIGQDPNVTGVAQRLGSCGFLAFPSARR